MLDTVKEILEMPRKNVAPKIKIGFNLVHHSLLSKTA